MAVRLEPLDPENTEDVDAAYSVAVAMETAAGGWTDYTRDSFLSLLASTETLPGARWIAREGERVVGVLVVGADHTGHDLYIDFYGDPMGGQPLVEHLIAIGLETAQREAGAHPLPEPDPAKDPYVPDASRWQVETFTLHEDTVSAAALTSLGFRSMRTFHGMFLEYGDDVLAAPAAPAGVTISCVESREDREVMGELMRRSFADHFGSTSDYDTDEWLAEVSIRPGCTPDRWWIARLDGVPVGYCMSDGTRAGVGEAHVMNLGVIPEARGRGIGKWMLQLAIEQGQREGWRGIGLSVDTGNTTPALQLYESVGMRARRVYDFWSRPA